MDLACLLVGRRIEEMTQPDDKGKPRMRTEEALRILTPPELWEEREAKPRSFRSARGVVQRIGVPESGVW